MADEKLEFVGRKKEFPMVLRIGRGLENVITNNTLIGHIDGEKGKLYYRGIEIEELAQHSTFEETAYLLIYGKLPNKQELDEFTNQLTLNRDVPPEVIECLKALPEKTHPMNLLAAGVALLAGYDENPQKMTLENERRVSINLISKIATLAGAIARINEKKPIVAPDPTLSHAANLLYMITGKKADDFDTRAMDRVLILHADHGMNASTFTAMVIHSSLSDIYSSVSGAIGSLKGFLHGGANQCAITSLREIGSIDNLEEWYQTQRKLKRRIYGFGHRVYRAYDPRARMIKDFVLTYCAEGPVHNLCQIADRLEELVLEDFGKTKGIFPNVDLYSGLVYLSLGIEPYLFTPLFAVGRVVGWTARILEYMKDNRLFRPRSHYYGPLDLKYVPIDERN
ncbi:MAG: citrate/2-methylcitrate synthase [Candidatus Hodarchaeota archaeon]